MNKILAAFFLLLFHFSFFTIHCEAQPGQWTWMSGSTVNNSPGSYGTQGVFSATNYPPSLYEACQWTDLNGNLWLYGGANASLIDYGDLWEYNTTTNLWAWINGPGTPQVTAVYGTEGVPAPSNYPGSRSWCASTWVDANGDFWMFGGCTITSNNHYTDLWRYNIASNEWTWMNGSSTMNTLGVYGTQGVPAAGNFPGARRECDATWTDNNNNLWLFGGIDDILGSDVFSDLWEYNITTNEWAWMAGPNTANGVGSWGTLGVPSATNVPSGRRVYCSWKHPNGDLWFFGGNNDVNSYNDMWRFNISTNMWTWMSGTQNLDDAGISGAMCVPDSTYIPSGRYENRARWVRGCNLQPQFLLWGGGSPIGAQNYFGDMWNYDVYSNKWTWTNGTLALNASPNYGTMTVSSPTNTPGGRMGAVSWTDNSGNLWMFGGFGSGYWGADLWRFVVDTTCPPPINPPHAAFTVSADSGCSPFTVNFTNSSTNSNAYLWTFGDGGTSTAISPSHTYNVTGHDTITLVAMDTGTCFLNDTATFVVLTLIPLAVNLGPDTSLCVGNPITIDAGNPGMTFLWSNGATTETISPTASGLYAVTVSTTNSCPGHDSINITFIQYPVVHLGNDTSICLGDSLLLNAGNPGYDYLWSTNATTQNITVNTAGNYKVTVTSTVADCSGNDSITITINPLPVLSLGNDTTACNGQPITLDAHDPGDFYHWNTGASTETISPVVTNTYSVTVTDVNGCKDTASVLVTFIPYPNVNLGPDQILCSNAVLLLFGGTPATSYLWQDGSTNSTFLALTGGTYWVTSGNQNCFKSDTIILTTVEAPPVNVGPDIRICYGQDTALTATTPGTIFLWNTGATTRRIPITTSGTYWVQVDWDGCSGTDTANVFIDKQIILNLGDDTTICPGDTMSITPGNQFIRYWWLPGQQVSSTIVINQPGTYVVTVTDSNNCVAAGSRLVGDYCEPEIYVPNTFTPNGNGINDIFYAYGVGIVSFDMYVFDRWGELLFQSNDISKGWDGTYMGNLCQQDIYVYRIDYKLYNSTELQAHTIYGNVNLIR